MKMVWLERWFVNSWWWNWFTARFLYRPLLRKIVREPGDILEVGCGVGKTSELIRSRFPGAKVTALDFDPVQISIARNERASIATFVEGDATHLAFKDASFDAVFAFMTFHHISDYAQALRECHRVLKRDGYLYVLDLGSWSIHRVGWLFPAVVFSKEEFLDEARAAGFVVEAHGGKRVRFTLAAKKG